MVYYNEFDRKKAAWLRELIKAGAIANGEVDERSICDVQPADVIRFTQCQFFAGIGIWSYALRQAGWSDDKPVWTFSCPCQPFSAAGKKKGFEDRRHLWPEMLRILRIGRPVVAFGEQVSSPDGLNWLDSVRSDLESETYTFGAVDLCAAGAGAPHIRNRTFFMADVLAIWERMRPQETTSGMEFAWLALTVAIKGLDTKDEQWLRYWAASGYGMANAEEPSAAEEFAGRWRFEGSRNGMARLQTMDGELLDLDPLIASGATQVGFYADQNGVMVLPVGGPLNPAHSRWLMALPTEWDVCGVTAMESLPRLRKSSSKPVLPKCPKVARAARSRTPQAKKKNAPDTTQDS